MPHPAAHQLQAVQNRDFAYELIRSRPDDHCAMQWAVTALFYAAVHCVDGALVRATSFRPYNHDERFRALLQASTVPLEVRRAYRVLYDLSRSARYDLGQFSADDVRRIAIEEFQPIARFADVWAAPP